MVRFVYGADNPLQALALSKKVGRVLAEGLLEEGMVPKEDAAKVLTSTSKSGNLRLQLVVTEAKQNIVIREPKGGEKIAKLEDVSQDIIRNYRDVENPKSLAGCLSSWETTRLHRFLKSFQMMR